VPEGWFDRLDPPSADETAMLEGAVDPHPNSRLSCQIAVSPALEGLTVHVPKNQF
jgi:2Fe-2S ferredoxin